MGKEAARAALGHGCVVLACHAGYEDAETAATDALGGAAEEFLEALCCSARRLCDDGGRRRPLREAVVLATNRAVNGGVEGVSRYALSFFLSLLYQCWHEFVLSCTSRKETFLSAQTALPLFIYGLVLIISGSTHASTQCHIKFFFFFIALISMSRITSNRVDAVEHT